MSNYQGYHAIARVYDRLNAEIDYVAWADFVEACFRRFLRSSPELVLDLACGTGRMTFQLADRGYDMIGVDGSADMLSEAYLRKGERGNVLLLQQDMRELELYGTVGAAVCCLDSLNYLLCQQDLTRCFSHVHNYLDPDGLFLFDMNTPYKFRNVYGDNAYVLEDELVWDEGEETEERVPVYCGWQNSFCEETGICDFDLSVFEELPDGTYRRSDEVQQERCYTLEQIKATLEQTGFELLGVWEDYDFSMPTDTTQRWYFAARAKK
ncbi:MAG: class I SAM-dependent methyltransferase [Clostridia bacterium]|nr:class I SAM-dependent methyltransferase [Clostridia bacterium]